MKNKPRSGPLKALVTGGTRGIGAAAAIALAEAGYQVTITGTSAHGRLPKGGTFLPCDFLSEKEVDALVAHIARSDFDVLVNNAGINKIGRLEDYALSDFRNIQQVNVTVPFLLCRAVLPAMRKKRFGRIVNITSIFGKVSRAGRSAYSASKFALFGMSRALALEGA